MIAALLEERCRIISAEPLHKPSIKFSTTEKTYTHAHILDVEDSVLGNEITCMYIKLSLKGALFHILKAERESSGDCCFANLF